MAKSMVGWLVCAFGAARVLGVILLPLQSSAAERSSFADVVKKVEPSVGTIRTDRGNGSGFLIDSQGTVVTNYHVVEGIREATFVFRDGARSTVAGFVVIDPGSDLAILRL